MAAILQSYALRHFLVMKGYDVEYIYRRHNKPSLYFYIRYAISRFFKNLKNREWKSLLFNYEDAYMMKKGSLLYPFFCEYICTSRTPIYSTRRLRKECRKYDAIIVGSDRVWRYRYAKDSIDDFFCNFLIGTGIPHFSYAASIGTDEMEYPKEKIEICSNLLKSFKAISVREQSTVDILRSYFGVKDAQVVLDPTLLLDKHIYIDLFKNQYTGHNRPYVFTYVLDEDSELRNAIEEFASLHQLEIINLRAQTGSIKEIKAIEPVEKWLSALYYSDYVITDSFHGTVFSLIFNKPFVVYGNSTRGLARLEDLLHRFGLSERLVPKSSDVCNILDTQVDWRKIENIIDKNKVASLSFLNNALRYDK